MSRRKTHASTFHLFAFLVVAGSSIAEPIRAQSAVAAPSISPSARTVAPWRAAITRAVAEHPGLRALAARVEAARRRVPQTLELPDPEIEVGLEDFPARDLSFSRDDFTMLRLSGSQQIPGRGKRAALRTAAEADVGIAEAALKRAEIEIAAEVADLYFQRLGVERDLALLDTTRRRLDEAAEAATDRYRVGAASAADVLLANLERTRLDDKLATLEAERRQLAVRSKALLGISLSEEDPEATGLEMLGLENTDLEAWAAAAVLRVRTELLGVTGAIDPPAVAEQRAQILLAERNLQLATLERRPDWRLSASYGRRQRFDDLVAVGASVTWPSFRRRRLEEQRAEREAELAAARFEALAVANEIRGEVEAVLAQIEGDLARHRLLVRSILPQAELAERAARDGYVVGKVEFPTLLRIASDLDADRREAAEHLVSIGRALATLARLSGLPLLTDDNFTWGDAHVER